MNQNPSASQAVRAIDDELHRACALVANRLGSPYTRLPHGVAHFGAHPRCGGLFDDLLVAALQRAVALKQVHGVGAVAKDLHLDVARFCVTYFSISTSGLPKAVVASP